VPVRQGECSGERSWNARSPARLPWGPSSPSLQPHLGCPVRSENSSRGVFCLSYVDEKKRAARVSTLRLAIDRGQVGVPTCPGRLLRSRLSQGSYR